MADSLSLADFITPSYVLDGETVTVQVGVGRDLVIDGTAGPRDA